MLVLESLEKAEVEVANELLGEVARAPPCVRRRTRLCTHACVHILKPAHSRIHVLLHSQLCSRRTHMLVYSGLHGHRVGAPGIRSPFPARLRPLRALLERRLVRAGG